MLSMPVRFVRGGNAPVTSMYKYYNAFIFDYPPDAKEINELTLALLEYKLERVV
jgi:hypothetical protein